MTNLQESRMSMFHGFKEFQAKYGAITSTLPNYDENYAKFLSVMAELMQIAEQQKISKSGITDLKNQLKEKLVVTTADYARKLGVYAKFSHDTVLVKEIKFSESKLRQVADTAVRDYAQIVYDRAQPIVKDLAAYGITPASQTELAATIEEYNNVIGKPLAGRTEGSKTTKQLAELFKAADAALADLDAAVEIVRLSQPTFYNSYKNARRVLMIGGSSLALKALITDAHTGEPIKGATIEFVLDGGVTTAKAISIAGGTVASMVKRSAAKGGMYVKNLPEGVYTVTIRKVGYADQQVTLPMASGDAAELKVQLRKN